MVHYNVKLKVKVNKKIVVSIGEGVEVIADRLIRKEICKEK